MLMTSQILPHERLRIVLATTGCGLFSVLYAVAYYSVSWPMSESTMGRSKQRKAKLLIKILLPRCIIIGGNFAVLVFEQRGFQMLVSTLDYIDPGAHTLLDLGHNGTHGEID